MIRQRLIGILVLLCGGVVLWSVLFDSPAEYKLDRSSQIPQAPHIDPVLNHPPEPPRGIPSADVPPVAAQPVIEPEPAELAAAEPTPTPSESSDKTPPAKAVSPPKPVVEDESPSPALAKTAASEPASAEAASPPASAEPVLDSNNLPVAWLVQVGSFGKRENADSLKQRLQDKGYKAYVDQRDYRERKLFRVLVGPILAKDRAEQQQGEINRAFNVKSIVTRFEGGPLG